MSEVLRGNRKCRKKSERGKKCDEDFRKGFYPFQARNRVRRGSGYQGGGMKSEKAGASLLPNKMGQNDCPARYERTRDIFFRARIF